MLRRNLRHIRRYPSLSIMLVAQPILFLLLFVYVFGGTLGAGLPGQEGGGDRSDYLVFITPGILIMTIASVALGTALSTATDMTTGIVARFRTMDIARVSVLTGHVLGAVIKTGCAVVTVAVPGVGVEVRQSLNNGLLQRPGEYEVRQALNDLNYRLRYALGEYDEPLPSVPVQGRVT